MSPSYPSPILAVDTGSPTPSVALERPGEPPIVRAAEPRACSERLLGLIDETLSEAGLELAQLGGMVALRGPGSFTGLRVGLATVLGLHQATGLPATAVPTLEVIGRWALAQSPAAACLAVVDALRDHWFVARFARDQAGVQGDASRSSAAEVVSRLREDGALCLAGFGAARLAAAAGHRGDTLEPRGLAAAAARQALERPPAWDPTLLTRPLYLQPPAATGAAGGA
ncbi:MAG TPA: tRNA (adenosine(37)-N6)-threonylcarbamoyltransferase complex dimerization subunit type 1 TsaB [Thermoanaerobaculia bacterium]|nr:tRNA (adenosine(37)-N6)-threonylcarbamoyltransferase complex dimerization subunit type 1 TsaB [Thermoanaerobaculia bacterium]